MSRKTLIVSFRAEIQTQIYRMRSLELFQLHQGVWIKEQNVLPLDIQKQRDGLKIKVIYIMLQYRVSTLHTSGRAYLHRMHCEYRANNVSWHIIQPLNFIYRKKRIITIIYKHIYNCNYIHINIYNYNIEKSSIIA